MNDNLTPHKTSDYDREVIRTIPYYDQFHSETISLINVLNPGANTWLDTGCGTGKLIEKTLIEFPQCTFYLSDPSENMLSVCTEKFKNRPVKLLGKYQTSEIQSDIHFAVITAIQSHHYMDFEGRISTTDHCYNLLKSKGIYITFENIRPESREGIETGLKRWGIFQRKQGRSEDVVKNHLNRFDKDYFPITVNEHLDILRRAGFRVAELFWMSYMQAGFYAIK